MGAVDVMDKIAAARRVEELPKRAAATAGKLATLLAHLPRELALDIARTTRARLAELDLAVPDASMLRRIGAGWVSAVADLAAVDGPGAAALVRAMLDQIRHQEWM